MIVGLIKFGFRVNLSPKPLTLNPKPQTPNPKPQTLNPKPKYGYLAMTRVSRCWASGTVAVVEIQLVLLRAVRAPSLV